ncbi:MAG TPA: DUF1761 domain-containing protein [Acidobacteriaceae bacterium]|nr:DUF1761 domain-containing protein [Acidobacteriaceae bacterium]
MLFLFWLVLCLLGISLLLLPLLLWRHELYRRYSGGRLVACPENQQAATVSVDARHAAATGIHGHPDLRLCDCTRWPERANCGQACLSQALQAEAPREVRVGTKPIHHLPILLAAFAAWCLGAIWHSQYLFRPRLMDAIGLTRAQLAQIKWWVSPHLLTLAVCVLFAYGVGWLLAVAHRKGVLQGVLMAVLLGGALVVASSYGIAGLPRDLLAIEAGYIVLALLIVGAIVGGLYDKLVLPSH